MAQPPSAIAITSTPSMAITRVDATDKGRVAGGGAGSFDEEGAFTGRLV
jgi:hypothetical protein